MFRVTHHDPTLAVRLVNAYADSYVAYRHYLDTQAIKNALRRGELKDRAARRRRRPEVGALRQPRRPSADAGDDGGAPDFQRIGHPERDRRRPDAAEDHPERDPRRPGIAASGWRSCTRRSTPASAAPTTCPAGSERPAPAARTDPGAPDRSCSDDRLVMVAPPASSAAPRARRPFRRCCRPFPARPMATCAIGRWCC